MMFAAQPRERSTDILCMQVQSEAWGGIAVVWAGGQLTMLFDVRDAWLAWNGRLERRVAIGLA
jgi:hypothetical protein